jgi:hypothetical protein
MTTTQSSHIIMGRLYCGHVVYVSTGGSSTGLLWEDCVVVMVSMCLLGALLLDYYGKTIDTMTTIQSSHNNPVVESPVDT